MYRSGLIKMCNPMEPEEALVRLTELRMALEDSAWATPEDKMALTAAVSVFAHTLSVVAGTKGEAMDGDYFKLIDGILATEDALDFLDRWLNGAGTLVDAAWVIAEHYALQPKAVIEWYGEVLNRRLEAAQSQLKEMTTTNDGS